MIHAKDFRIGNFVMFEEDQTVFMIYKIEFSGLSVKNKDEDTWIEIDSLCPLPLTEEWLLKFGFNKDYKKGYIGIDISNQDFVLTEPKVMGLFQSNYYYQFESGGWQKYKEFKFVHELQNFVYSLFSIELQPVSTK